MQFDQLTRREFVALLGGWALATCAALLAVMMSHLRGQNIEATSQLPFGASSVRRCGSFSTVSLSAADPVGYAPTAGSRAARVRALSRGGGRGDNSPI